MRALGDGAAVRWFRFSTVALALGGVTGFVLSSLGLLPTPDLDLRWTVPIEEDMAYAPTGAEEAGEQWVLVYVGSSTCPWANEPDIPRLLRAMKNALQSQARHLGIPFFVLGIARDRMASEGLTHLSKLGVFDEVAAGGGQTNLGLQHYVYGSGALAGPSVTPQVVLLSRTLADPAGRIDIDEERVLLRRTGLGAIREWAEADFVVPAPYGLERPYS